MSRNPYGGEQISEFDQAAPRSNPAGIVGFVLAFCVPPLGFLISLIAVFKRPRGFAVAGLIIGAIGSIIAAVVVYFAAALGPFMAGTFMDFELIKQGVSDYRGKNAGQLPADLSLTTIPAEALQDHWGNAWMYTPASDNSDFTLVSAGFDGIAGTADDITLTGNMSDNEIGEVLGESFKASKGATTP